MAREVDKRKTRKALRRLNRVAERAQEPDAPALTAWEKEFVSEVSQRLETYGSAFRDPAKGSLEEALSARQTDIVRTLSKKARARPKAAKTKNNPKERPPKSPAGRLKRRPPAARSRDINEDVAAPEAPPAPRRPDLTLIRGGKTG